MWWQALFCRRCLCSSKTRKSESNSQQACWTFSASWCCLCSSKTRKSESNSQQTCLHRLDCLSCLCSSKTRKSESNSQHFWRMEWMVCSCLCSSKTRKIWEACKDCWGWSIRVDVVLWKKSNLEWNLLNMDSKVIKLINQWLNRLITFSQFTIWRFLREISNFSVGMNFAYIAAWKRKILLLTSPLKTIS